MALYSGPSLHLSLHWLGFTGKPWNSASSHQLGLLAPTGAGATLQRRALSTQSKMNFVFPLCVFLLCILYQAVCVQCTLVWISALFAVSYQGLCVQTVETQGKAPSLLSWRCSGELNSRPNSGLKHSWIGEEPWVPPR